MKGIGQSVILLTLFWVGTTRGQDFKVVEMGKSATALVDDVKNKSTATAFCIHPTGVFATNHHVVKDTAKGEKLTLVMNVATDKERTFACTVLRSSEDSDLALLKTTTPGEFPYLQFGNDNEVFETLPTIAFGFPFGKDLSVDKDAYPAMSINTGRITAIRQKQSKVDLFQLDTKLNPGNSGGPILQSDGKVIGVVSRGVFLSGVNFAIPVGKLKRLVAAPDVEIELPKDIAADPGSPKTLTVNVKPLLEPLEKLTIDMNVELGGQQSRSVAMTPSGAGVFSGQFVPVPAGQQKDVIVDAEATYQLGHVVGKAIDTEFLLDKKTFRLSDVRQITSGKDGDHQLEMVDGDAPSGKLKGLTEVTINLGPTTSKIDLSKASKIKLRVRKPAFDAKYTIVVRNDGKEIFRKVTSTSSSVDSGAVARYTGESKSIPIPGKVSDVILAGGGTQMLLVLAATKKLAVLDLVSGEIRKFLPLGSHDVLVAGTQSYIVILDRSNNVLERWSIKDLVKERTVKPPFQGIAKSLVAGHAVEGPVIALWAQGSGALSRCQFMSIDVQTLEGKSLDAKGGRLHVSYRDAMHLRMSADGTIFGMWATSHSPQGLNSVRVQGSQLLGLNEHTSVGHVVPGPDGMHLFTGIGGVFTNELKAKSVNRRPSIPCVPTTHPNFYVTVPAEPGAQRNMGRDPFKGMKPSLNVVSSQSVLAELPDLALGSDNQNRSWTTSDFSLDKRVHFHVQAGVLAAVPFTNDKVWLHKLDLEELLRKSKTDYFVINSVPKRTFVPGERYVYKCSVLARRGDAEFELASGPEGMDVSAEGILSWDVPDDFDESSVNVIINVGNGEDQSVYESFTLQCVSNE